MDDSYKQINALIDQLKACMEQELLQGKPNWHSIDKWEKRVCAYLPQVCAEERAREFAELSVEMQPHNDLGNYASHADKKLAFLEKLRDELG
jgi:hypothetical protein